MNLNTVLAMECRKLALTIIHRRWRGDYYGPAFRQDLYQLAREVERFTGLQCCIILTAWLLYYDPEGGAL